MWRLSRPLSDRDRTCRWGALGHVRDRAVESSSFRPWWRSASPSARRAGTSLAALLLPVGLLGVIEYARRHEIRFHSGIGMRFGLLAGVLVGAVLAGRFSNTLLERLFGLLLAIVAFKFLLFPAEASQGQLSGGRAGRGSNDGRPSTTTRRMILRESARSD